MNRRALLVMFVLLTGAGLFAFLQRSKDDRSRAVRSPLETIDYSAVSAISAQREEQAPWRLEKQGSSLALRSAAVAGGSSVAGSPEMRARILGFLQDASWIEHRAVADLDLAEWGLEPPFIRAEVMDGAGPHRFDVGRPDMNGDVWVRGEGDERAFKYPARVLEDLGREPRWYRDPRLADIPAHLVESIRVAPRSRAAYDLKRVGRSWFVTIEGGRTFRAEPDLADRLGVALANLSGEPADGDLATTVADEDAAFAIAVTGAGRECRYLILALDGRGILARRGDEPDLRFIDRMVARYLIEDPEEIEDRRLLGLDFAELGAIELSGAGRENLRLARNGEFWRVVFDDLLLRPVDPEAFRGLRERIEGLRVSGGVELPGDFEPQARLRLDFDDDLAIPPLMIDFGAARPDGSRVVRRSDQADGLLLETAVDDLLGLRYWDLMVRYFSSCRADEIGEFSIRDPEGLTYSLRRSGGTGAWQLVDLRREGETIAGFAPRPVPAEPLERLIDRLAQPTVAGFLGEKSDEELARIFAAPRYVLTWKSPEMLLVPPTDSRTPRITEEKTWEIGARLDDDRLQARISLFPALVFPVSGDDLLPVTDALRAIRD